jgi:hypothetical protein
VRTDRARPTPAPRPRRASDRSVWRRSLTCTKGGAHRGCGSSPPARPSCMERDSGSGTAAFNGCRSAVGADCALADAWSSSACGPTADALGSTREGQASTRSILSRHLRNRKPPFSSSGDSCALGGTLSLTRLRTGRMGVTGRKHPILGVLCWCGTRQPPRGGSVRRKSDGKSSASDSDGGNIQKCETRRRLARASDRGPSMTAADGCSLDTGRAVG